MLKTSLYLACLLPLAGAFTSAPVIGGQHSMALRRASGLLAPVLRGGGRAIGHQSRRSFAGSVSMSDTPPKASAGKHLLYVKKGKGEGTVGDCPHTQKAHMALRLKDLPIELAYIDLLNKPEWYFKINEKGTVPTLIKDGTSEKLVESDDICKFCDEVGVGAKIMGQPGSEKVLELITPLWGKIVNVIKNKDKAAEEGLVQELHAALKGIESHIHDAKTPFLLGNEITHPDCKLAPFLQHAKIALPHFKKFNILRDYPSTMAYYTRISATEAFKKSTYSDDDLIFGWEGKLKA